LAISSLLILQMTTVSAAKVHVDRYLDNSLMGLGPITAIQFFEKKHPWMKTTRGQVSDGTLTYAFRKVSIFMITSAFGTTHEARSTEQNPKPA
jgi:hypothetical protein